MDSEKIVDLEELMELSPSTLAQKQHDALQKHVLDILDDVQGFVKHQHYDKIEQFTEPSHAGDYTGDDNDIIDFQYNGSDTPLDILEVCEKLASLKRMAQEGGN